MCDDICMETNLTKRAKYFAHRKHDADFAKTYLREKANMLKGFQNVNKELYAKVEKQLQDSLDSLGLS